MAPTRAAQTERVFTEFRRVIANVVIFNDRVNQMTGMSASESQFLHLLQINGDMTPSELAQASGLTSGTVTGVLDRLEQLSLVRRERHPTDRRKVVVAVDEQAVGTLFGPIYEDNANNLTAVMERFTVAELETIERFLVALTARD